MERIYADTRGGTIKLGRQGENEAREIIFDISRWTSLYGVGVASLVHKRHGDEYPYPCDIERNGDGLVWTVKLADVANDGVGECELIYTVDNIVVKSIIWSTFVAKSLTGDLEDAPKPEQSWVDRVISSANNAVSAIQKYPYISEENHHWMVWDAENGKFTDTGIIAEGQPGSGSSEWGNIGGSLSNQADLKNALDSKANKTELDSLNPVSANSGTGTDILQTLTVGDTTYNIPQGGGSGGDGEENVFISIRRTSSETPTPFRGFWFDSSMFPTKAILYDLVGSNFDYMFCDSKNIPISSLELHYTGDTVSFAVPFNNQTFRSDRKWENTGIKFVKIGGGDVVLDDQNSFVGIAGFREWDFTVDFSNATSMPWSNTANNVGTYFIIHSIVPNTIKFNFSTTPAYTSRGKDIDDLTLVAIANGLNSETTGKTFTVQSSVYNKMSTDAYKGTIDEDGIFTLVGEGGETTLADFITTTKGWGLAKV